MTNRLLFAALALLAFAAPPGPAGAQSAPNPRIALVIGESAYSDQTLATPVNDAALVAQTLQAAGFDVVGARDLDERSLRGALRDFLAKAAAIGSDMQAFVYLSGRGVQYEGENFFVPADAQIARDSDVPIEAVRVADFAHALAAEPGQARILVLDAARAHPYARLGSPFAGGLALIDPDPGMLMAFNAAPGSIAGDETGPYGVYAKTLAGAMREGGLPIDDVLAQTRVGVNQATGGAQLPWSASKLTAPYFIFERAADAPPAAAEAALADAARQPIRSFPAEAAYAAAIARDTLVGYQEFLAAYPAGPEAKRVRAILAARREALFWLRSVARDTPQAYWTYLSRYPRGPHVADAERRLAILSASAAPPADFAPEGYADLPPPPPDELAYADQLAFAFQGPDFGPPPPPPPNGFVAEGGDDWRDLPPPAPPTVVGVLPVLAVAVPLLVTARPYRDAGGRAGRAAPGAPPPVAQAPAPPPLPGGVGPKPPAPTPPTGLKPPPVIHEPPPAVHEPSPVVHEPPPVIHEPPPVVHEPSPVVHEPPPVVLEPPPVVHEPPPVVHATPTPTPSPTPLTGSKPPPVVHATPPPVVHATPTPSPTPLTGSKPPPVVHATPTPVVHAPPTPPPAAHAPPPAKPPCGKPGEPPCPR
jgi:uncharacterized caspase-like protein